ncbi:MAG: Asp-tRNA(Asn)/Glu-tRNA(Gln) amidotransferase subunit GatC [Gammaproteobacteria bacterium]|jgi:aspartyl-tRNA(Asn)/glutamyl-tRNA(Gln) amidotransferase subunit C|uniref:Aspartyl/glutamyl-tRNA(Asn/Gln) amidotransferase subunit C n=1 Tax=SAR86 cluster bacterium TaxID=2030880 RepID=A0A368C4V7_9GAMM|nr:MAG: Asp-tRNA(Asn)/Glu-tRNA(Gln) amidotransferase subunit GatC [SAR86 cluster bacterium]|tara:strand:+ start:1056 stop:1337 length:282 start_codon:yes stop_codon:yes gene_type:complete
MDKETVATISYLSRLAFDKDNEDKITKDLENIIKFVDQLESIDTSNIDPLTSPLEQTAKTRVDEVTAKNRKEKFLQNAPDANEDYFLVPRVVE